MNGNKNKIIPTILYNQFVGIIEKYGNPGSKDDILSKWIAEGQAASSDAKSLFKVFDLVGKIPDAVALLLKIHGITPAAKFLIFHTLLIRGVIQQRNEEFEKKKAAEYEKIKKELEELEKRNQLLNTSDRTEIVTDDALKLYESIEFEDGMEEIANLLKDSNIFFWMNVNPDTNPLSSKEREANKQPGFFPEDAESLGVIKGNLEAVSNEINTINSIDDIDKRISQLEVDQKNGNPLLIQKLNYVKKELEKGRSIEEIRQELTNIKNLFEVFSENEIITLFRDYRELWLAGNAYTVIPYHPDLAKTDTMTERTKKAFSDLGFRKSDPVMQLGFVTYPTPDDLNRIGGMLNRMPDNINGDIQDLLTSIGEINDGSKRKYIGEMFNNCSERDLEEYIQFNEMYKSVHAQIEEFAVDENIKNSILENFNKLLSLDPLSSDYDEVRMRIQLELQTSIEPLFDQDKRELLIFIEEINVFFGSYKEFVSIINRKSNIEEDKNLIEILEIFSQFLTEDRAMFNQIALACGGDFRIIFPESSDVPNQEYLNTLYKDNIKLRKSSIDVIRKSDQKNLRQAYIMHLEDLANGRVIALNNIKDRTKRDPQGLLYGRDGIISALENLEKESLNGAFNVEVKSRIINELATIDQFAPSRLFDLSDVFKKSYIGEKDEPLEVLLKHVKPDRDGNTTEVKPEFSRFISVSSKLVHILKEREVEILQNLTTESFYELDYIRTLQEKFKALGITCNDIGEVNVNYGMFVMYFNGVHTYVPSAKISRLRDDLVDLNTITNDDMYAVNKVYLGGRMKINKPVRKPEVVVRNGQVPADIEQPVAIKSSKPEPKVTATSEQMPLDSDEERILTNINQSKIDLLPTIEFYTKTGERTVSGFSLVINEDMANDFETKGISIIKKGEDISTLDKYIFIEFDEVANKYSLVINLKNNLLANYVTSGSQLFNDIIDKEMDLTQVTNINYIKYKLLRRLPGLIQPFILPRNWSKEFAVNMRDLYMNLMIINP